MSRAFVNEDRFVEELPDRPVSGHPNHVTRRGLELIEAALDEARRSYGEAQAAGDREALASAGRDLRYWSARRASAQIVSPDPDIAGAQFGSTVTIARDDGRTQIFGIVGEEWRAGSGDDIARLSAGAGAFREGGRRCHQGREGRSRDHRDQAA